MQYLLISQNIHISLFLASMPWTINHYSNVNHVAMLTLSLNTTVEACILLIGWKHCYDIHTTNGNSKCLTNKPTCARVVVMGRFHARRIPHRTRFWLGVIRTFNLYFSITSLNVFFIVPLMRPLSTWSPQNKRPSPCQKERYNYHQYTARRSPFNFGLLSFQFWFCARGKKVKREILCHGMWMKHNKN